MECEGVRSEVGRGEIEEVIVKNPSVVQQVLEGGGEM